MAGAPGRPPITVPHQLRPPHTVDAALIQSEALLTTKRSGKRTSLGLWESQ